jgi:hypothetical protein
VDSVDTLVQEGARIIAEGVRNRTPMADLGRQVGRVQLKIHTQLRTREGLPDLRAVTRAAKDANRTMFALSGVDADLAEGVIKSVHNHKSDVRAEYLRSLDEPGADLEPYASLLQEGVAPSVAVAAHYGVSTQGRRERERKVMSRLRRVRVPNGTPSERAAHVAHAVDSLLSDVQPDDFRSLRGKERATAQREITRAAEHIAAITEAVQR